jgi:acetylglutamate kinase
MNRTVIKLGGSILIDEHLRRQLLGQIVELIGDGHQLVLVHGGGKQIARLLQQVGLESRFHDGLRITDAATRDVVQMVLAGLVGKNLVAELQAAGVMAASIAGGDGGSLLATRMAADDGTDLGYVGRIVAANPALTDQLLAGGITPVVACLALGADDHQYYNVNGDQMAAAVAGAGRVSTLILVTDVGGVMDAGGRLIPTLTPPAIAELLDSGVAGGGMRPKLRACLEALAHGVETVRIVGAAEPDVLCRVLNGGEVAGTTIVAQ